MTDHCMRHCEGFRQTKDYCVRHCEGLLRAHHVILTRCPCSRRTIRGTAQAFPRWSSRQRVSWHGPFETQSIQKEKDGERGKEKQLLSLSLVLHGTQKESWEMRRTADCSLPAERPLGSSTIVSRQREGQQQRVRRAQESSY